MSPAEIALSIAARAPRPGSPRAQGRQMTLSGAPSEHGARRAGCPSRLRGGSRTASAAFTALAASVVACGGTAAPDARALGGDTALAAPQIAGRVTLTVEALAAAGIRVQPARADSSRADAESRTLQVPGQVELDPRRVAVVSSRLDGRLEQLHVVEGDKVQEGQPVAALYSPAFLAAQSDLQQADRRAALLRSSTDSAGARALADAAARRLSLMGSSASDIAALRRGDAAASTLDLRSPLTGSVLRAHVLTGRAVAAGEPVFTVADLSVLDVVAEVPEVSLPMLRVGQRAAIGIAAFPSLRVVGTVERIRDALEPETRTVRAVIHVQNSGHSLRPGMYASVRLDVSRGPARGAVRAGVLLPETAIVTDGVATVVFVELAARTFERRVVRVESLSPPGTLRPASPDVRVADGLRAGERVVIRGAFLLKSELAKSALAEDK